MKKTYDTFTNTYLLLQIPFNKIQDLLSVLTIDVPAIGVLKENKVNISFYRQ
jgi:hypothetical protein